MDRRTKHIRIRVTPEEKFAFEKAARLTRETVSAWLRRNGWRIAKQLRVV